MVFCCCACVWFVRNTSRQVWHTTLVFAPRVHVVNNHSIVWSTNLQAQLRIIVPVFTGVQHPLWKQPGRKALEYALLLIRGDGGARWRRELQDAQYRASSNLCGWYRIGRAACVVVAVARVQCSTLLVASRPTAVYCSAPHEFEASSACGRMPAEPSLIYIRHICCVDWTGAAVGLPVGQLWHLFGHLWLICAMVS
jgi:hypothetical protein